MNSNALKTFEAARAAVHSGEARSLSARTMNRLWAAYFKAEDTLKAVTAGVCK